MTDNEYEPIEISVADAFKRVYEIKEANVNWDKFTPFPILCNFDLCNDIVAGDIIGIYFKGEYYPYRVDSILSNPQYTTITKVRITPRKLIEDRNESDRGYIQLIHSRRGRHGINEWFGDYIMSSNIDCNGEVLVLYLAMDNQDQSRVFVTKRFDTVKGLSHDELYWLDNNERYSGIIGSVIVGYKPL